MNLILAVGNSSMSCQPWDQHARRIHLTSKIVEIDDPLLPVNGREAEELLEEPVRGWNE